MVVIHTSSTSLSTYQPSRILWCAAYLRQQWSLCADVVDLQIVESAVRSLCEIVMCNSAARGLDRKNTGVKRSVRKASQSS
ncbi:Peptide chain release factor [Trichinella spiralis]|uniref:Peptide chain release factor n=1 Tax=Trichinella spiralis TaxID=6334 RepID=A0ABR3K5M3_TRISP